MKRARTSSSIDSDASSAGAASSTSLDLAKSPLSSSSSSSSSAVEEFEEPSAVPLVFILGPVLSLLKEKEIFADALKRLSHEKSDAIDQLTDLHRTAMAQYELVLMHMSRESILLKALAEARHSGASLPRAWVLRWTAKPGVEHGPFTDGTIEKWAREGFFSKKQGELRDLNAVNAPWVPALDVVKKL
jgi:hypothetical protein